MKGFPQYPPVFQRCLLLLGHLVTKLLDTFKVEWITCGGTLLGQVREGGLIGHDDDIDFEVFAHSRKQFFDAVKYAQQHPEYGLCTVLHLPQMVKFTPMVSGPVFRKIGFDRPGIANPTADVFLNEPAPDGGYRLTVGWPKWRYMPGEVFPIQKLPFSGQLWNAPRDPTGILRRHYGDDYMTPRFYKWHTTKKSPKKKKCSKRCTTTSSPP